MKLFMMLSLIGSYFLVLLEKPSLFNAIILSAERVTLCTLLFRIPSWVCLQVF